MYQGIVSNATNTVAPNRTCCSDPHHLCAPCAREAGVVDCNDIIPIPTINWAEEQAQRLANRPSYHGKSSLPRGTKTEEPAPMFAPRHFEDVLQAAEPVPKATPTYYPSQGTLVTNLPDVKGDVLPTSEQMWAEAIEEDRRRLGL